eukprot:537174-Amphidinium_carterae.3
MNKDKSKFTLSQVQTVTGQAAIQQEKYKWYNHNMLGLLHYCTSAERMPQLHSAQQKQNSTQRDKQQLHHNT